MCLIFFVPPGLTFGSDVVRKYHYVDTALSWWDARTHCKAEFANLATVKDREDADRLLRVLPLTGSYVWIGLHDDLSKLSWSMKNTSFNNQTDYSNWETETEIDNSSSRDKCILMKTSGTWLDWPCEEEQLLVCYDGRRGIYFKNRFKISQISNRVGPRTEIGDFI